MTQKITYNESYATGFNNFQKGTFWNRKKLRIIKHKFKVPISIIPFDFFVTLVSYFQSFITSNGQPILIVII